MPSSPSTAAIILAAGSSSRMGAGRHKLLLPLGERPVLAHVIDTTLASQARPIVVVLGHQAEQVRARIAPYATHHNISIIINGDYMKGISTSIHAGVQALMGRDDAPDSALVILGDQPLMTNQIIDKLIAARRTTGQRIITPLYNGQHGNPVLFDASLFPELMQITGDEGARSVVGRHRQQVATVELGDAMASFDVDTWEAYQQVVTEWQRQQQASRGERDGDE
jgi:molybdenum cofactor cytidylyltransferase